MTTQASFIQSIERYRPENEQEATDQRVMLAYIKQYPDTVLFRVNEIAHVTSSALILNRSLTRTLMVYHNIRDTWAWTGGHADGDADLYGVALREAKEETGVTHITPLTDRIVSTDILWVQGHIKRGRYVSAHLHLNVSYLLVCDENDPLTVKPDENSGVRWLEAEALHGPLFAKGDQYLYGKLADKARRIAAGVA